LRIQSYDLHLDVDFKRASVRGRVGLRVEGAGPELVLDSVGLEIGDVKVNGAPVRFSLDRAAGLLKIPAGSGVAQVEIDYGKEVPEEVIFGLYKSRYGPDYFLVTDLEPAEARKVFPCKDDPAHKAVFNLEVVTEKGLVVISNSTAESRKETEDGRMLHVFRPTPMMSTYLFFLGIGKFDEVKHRSEGVDVVVAARPNQAAKGKFILGVASTVLRDYSRYFGVSYPLKKLHLVALPEYHTGAMENWGAITAREAYVLVDENSGVSPVKRAALVIIHEIAHQWFGDLVTMKWWNDLWLNESFATFMEYKMLNRMRSQWDVWADFLQVDTFRSMNQDALPSTHPIEVDVSTPAEVGQVFDAISYGKGANVIRMIESHIGEEAFRRGVSAYLKDFSYANARGQDLWDHLEKASRQPVSKIMGTWVRKAGYPLVQVRTGRSSLTLSQRRFRLDGSRARSDDLWPIPVTLRVDGKRMSLLMDKKTASVRVPDARDH
jgi:tricorn protease interacting factor F2/3